MQYPVHPVLLRHHIEVPVAVVQSLLVQSHQLLDRALVPEPVQVQVQVQFPVQVPMQVPVVGIGSEHPVSYLYLSSDYLSPIVQGEPLLIPDPL